MEGVFVAEADWLNETVAQLREPLFFAGADECDDFEELADEDEEDDP